MFKNVTDDMLEKYKDTQSPSGFTIWNAIQSGLDNPDSGVGVYAGDEESYSVFADLFDKVIEDYHGYAPGATHTRDLDINNFGGGNPDPNGEYIVSTRIRVGRNLQGMPLTPKLSAEQRAEVEKQVTEVLNGFDGELAGKYYSLGGMSDAERDQLIADHFLFKKGDRFLESAGVNGNWPDNRGIFHNNDKTFLVWVNEEDQLRIISMQPGGDIKAVFGRLLGAVAKLEEKMKFAYNDHLGFISSCPTNLGTAMRASVHIKLPNLGKDPKFHQICEQYGLQPRGIHGEHSETDGGVYDISNKRRLGLSEVQCVQAMHDGVVKLIELEKELGDPAPPPLPKGLEGKVNDEYPRNARCLLYKYVTDEMLEKYATVKTANGYTLMDAIQSGLDNPDSGVGVYAGDEESYTAFGDLFDKIIEDYHGHGAMDVHTRDLDINNFGGGNPDPNGEYIVSTRIRVGRNLDGFPLNPCLDPGPRGEIEKQAMDTLSLFEGELAGKYYSLGGMSDAERDQLIADHFLFKKGDRFLESANVNDNWPENRGIFHNNDKTFLVWVNEEDQLRIISMQPGGDIKAVFGRLLGAVAKLEEKMKFQYNDHLGFISSCPTNLGTAMRASVHIKLPNLGKDPKFHQICEQYGLQPRGIHGEHSETDGGVYDISNKRRLGLSEVQCVQAMHDGVVKLIEMEKQLAASSASGIASSLESKVNKSIEMNPKCLMFKAVTNEMVSKYDGTVSPQGFTLMNCIQSGLDNPDSGVGVYAGDEECYSIFSDLFDKIIEDYHGYSKESMHHSDMNPDGFVGENPDAPGHFIISTRIRVGRNIYGFPLNPCVSKDHRSEIETQVTDALNGFDGDLAGKYYSLGSLSDAERDQLIADHFLFKKGDRFLESAGINNEWPDNRGIFHNHEKTFLVWVNEEDQLRIISMQPGGDIKAVFTRLCRAVAKLEEKLKFQYNDHLGFISSCPTNLGTAMRASVHIKLPCLSQNPKFHDICEEHGLQARGIHGEHSESEGGVFDISNKRRLGLSEVECVQAMYDGVCKLIDMEKSLSSNVAGQVPGTEDMRTEMVKYAQDKDLSGRLSDLVVEVLLCMPANPITYLYLKLQSLLNTGLIKEPDVKALWDENEQLKKRVAARRKETVEEMQSGMKNYIDSKNLRGFLTDLVTEVLRAKPENPLQFMLNKLDNKVQIDKDTILTQLNEENEKLQKQLP